jgi:hypothetical protein
LPEVAYSKFSRKTAQHTGVVDVIGLFQMGVVRVNGSKLRANWKKRLMRCICADKGISIWIGPAIFVVEYQGEIQNEDLFEVCRMGDIPYSRLRMSKGSRKTLSP